jgi:hypothetical protein
LPVEGKATLDGKALGGGVVTFLPDSKSSSASPTGEIGAGGTYKVSTNGAPGVAPGRYKVIVLPPPPPAGDPSEMAKGRPPAAAPGKTIPPKYTVPSTPLSVEVVASPAPGGYDLKLTSR